KKRLDDNPRVMKTARSGRSKSRSDDAMNASITFRRNAVRRSYESETQSGTIASGVQNSESGVERRGSFARRTSPVIAEKRPSCTRRRRVRAVPKRRRYVDARKKSVK